MTTIQKLAFAYYYLRTLFLSSDLNYKGNFLICIVLTCIIGFMEIFTIYLIAHLTSTALFDINTQSFLISNQLSFESTTVLATFCVLVIFAASSWNVYLLSGISYNSANKIAWLSLKNWFKKAFSRDLMQDSENRYSQAVKNILLDSEGVASNFIIPCFQLISSLSTLILLSFASLIKAPKESLFVLVFVFIFFSIVSKYIEPVLKSNSRSINSARKSLLLAFKESFSTYRLLKFRSAESNQIQKIHRIYRFYTSKLKINHIIANLPRLAIEAISYILVLFLISLVNSSSDPSSKSIVISQITFLILCLQRLIPLANRCYGYIAHLASHSSSVKEVINPLASANMIYSTTVNSSTIANQNCMLFIQSNHKISTESKESFDWSSIECIFSDTSPSLVIQKGDWIHLSGPSGCGKTSMLETLLLQDSSVNNNKILIFNEKNIKYSPQEFEQHQKDVWLSNIGYCPQNPELVSGSLARNLVYPLKISSCLNKLCAEHKRILDIVELVLPNSLLSRDLGEGANTLSGGQQQRLVLARELLTNPKLLIIDEGLSGVSEEMENRIYNNIRRSFPDISVVTVSHRFTLPSFFKCFSLQPV